jgi:pilus assembly protein CpaF
MSTQDLISALGPLGPLYADPQVREILVDGPERVRVERADAAGAKIEDIPLRFASAAALREVIVATLALSGVKLGPADLSAEASFPHNEARIVVVLPPAAVDGPYLVIRKLVVTSMTWDDLVRYGSVSPAARDLLLAALAHPVNFLITGSAGAGKITFANILASSIAPEQRLVVVEALPEFRLQHPRAVFLEAGNRVSFANLIATATRMRPDWLVIGEFTGPEALPALDLISRGHEAITMIHAESPDDALARLERMCHMANSGLSLAEIRAVIASAVRVITHQRYFPNGTRRLTDVVELRGLTAEGYDLQPLLRYNPASDQLELTGAKPVWEK